MYVDDIFVNDFILSEDGDQITDLFYDDELTDLTMHIGDYEVNCIQYENPIRERAGDINTGDFNKLTLSIAETGVQQNNQIFSWEDGTLYNSLNQNDEDSKIDLYSQLNVREMFRDVYVQDWAHSDFDSEFPGFHKVEVYDVDAGNSTTSQLDQYNEFYDVIYLKENNMTGSIWPEDLGGNGNPFQLENALIFRDISFLDPANSNMVLQEFLNSNGERRPFEWHSKNFGMENVSQLKTFMKVKLTYYNTRPFVYAMYDNNGTWEKLDDWDSKNETLKIPKVPVLDEEGNIIKYKPRKANTIKIKVKSAKNIYKVHDTEVDSIAIVYRDKEFVS